jgi:Tol biopolymer transport system component
MSKTFGRVGRISFSPDSRAVYYATADAIQRFEIASNTDEEIIPDVFARGGVTISPDGKALVYSDCRPRGPLRDISVSPPRVLVEDELAAEPDGGPDGLLTYVRDKGGRRTVVVRDKSGLSREVSARALGRASSPSIDPTGKWVAFGEEGSHPGIYVVDTMGRDLPKPITSGSTDTDPAWTRDGRIVFNRWVEPHIPYVYVVDRNTTEAKQAHPKVRRVLRSSAETGRILLASQDKTRLYLWDIDTGAEKPLSMGDLGNPYVLSAAFSPQGDFLVAQTGVAGRAIWKVPISSESKNPEKIFSADGDPSMSNLAVLSDGRIVVGVRYWLGELHLVPAREGQTF